MFCKNCGVKLDGGKFCPECGTKINEDASNAAAASEPAEQKKECRQSANMCCPKCGSQNLNYKNESTTVTTGTDYSAGKGCLGYLLFGPLGLLCGACGQSKTTTTTNKSYWVCGDCGHKFRNPQELREDIAKEEASIRGAITMMIVSGICSLILMFIGIGLEVFLLAVFAVIVMAITLLSFITIVCISAANKNNLQKELDKVERGMHHFRK